MTNKHTQESYFTCSRSHIHKQRNSVSYPSSSEGCSKLLFPWQFSHSLLRGKKRSEHPMEHSRNNDTGMPARDGTQAPLHGLKVATPGSNANTQLVQPCPPRPGDCKSQGSQPDWLLLSKLCWGMKTVNLELWSPNMVPRLAAAASLGNLLKVQILRHHAKLTDQKLWGLDPTLCVLTRRSWYTCKLKSQWIKVSGFCWFAFLPLSSPFLNEYNIIPITGHPWTNEEATAKAGWKLIFPLFNSLTSIHVQKGNSALSLSLSL